jgi:hypothetical protein
MAALTKYFCTVKARDVSPFYRKKAGLSPGQLYSARRLRRKP